MEASTKTSLTFAGAEVELKDGRKLSAKLVVLGDGVHSKTASKYHKMPLKHVDVGGWRYAFMHQHPEPVRWHLPL